MFEAVVQGRALPAQLSLLPMKYLGLLSSWNAEFCGVCLHHYSMHSCGDQGREVKQDKHKINTTHLE